MKDGYHVERKNRFDAQPGQEGSRSIVGRFKRLAQFGRAPIILLADGEPVTALERDTLMVAMLGAGKKSAQLGIWRRLASWTALR
jgi:hypothetical protein